MLSVPVTKIPRKISIKVARAEKLKESIIKDGKKKVNNKFKVTVLGGKKKESSTTEVGVNGNVQWSFSPIIKLHRNQADPLSILVEDSDGHHRGQVIIPIVKIPPKPYTYSPNQDPATSNNILCSELEPTKKCSDPSGFLLYWIWVEEYYPDEDGDSGKKSFNKSMSSLFGSKSKLGSSKTNLEIKNPDSISNYSSVTSLNKPEKHKKSLSLLKLKIGSKKKHKPTVSDAPITPDSSDVETSSNFSFNQGHPFENDVRHGHSSTLSDALNTTSGYPSITVKNYDPNQRSEILSHGSPDSYSDNQYGAKSGDVQSHISNNINPTVLPSYENPNAHISSNLSNKYNTLNTQDLSAHKDHTLLSKVPNAHHPSEVDSTFRYGHNKSSVGSDYSMFSDRNYEPQVSAVSKVSYEEFENMKKENTELKSQNVKSSQEIKDLRSELDEVKYKLWKLRARLLEENATKYLEI